MAEEQVKGSLVASAAESIRTMVSSGKISQQALEARLPAAPLEVLEVKVDVIQWYPVAIYRELLDLYWHSEGGGVPGFMRSAGAAGARALVESGLYRAFVNAATAPGKGVRGLVRRAQITCRLTDLLYDFLEMSVELDEDRGELRIVYDNAASFSQAMFLGTHGFLDGFTEAAAIADGLDASTGRWRADRPEPGRLVFSHEVDGLLTGV